MTGETTEVALTKGNEEMKKKKERKKEKKEKNRCRGPLVAKNDNNTTN